MLFSSVEIALKRTYQVSIGAVCSKRSREPDAQSSIAPPLYDSGFDRCLKAFTELAKAIHDYFDVTPPGKSGPPGMIAFAGALLAVEDPAGHGKADLDRIQIEGILLGIVKRDVMTKQAAKDTQPSANK
jgi:hypothetical protein